MAVALDILLQDWHERLRAWSADGSLASAARHALELDYDPPLLTELVTQWAEGDFSGLTPVIWMTRADTDQMIQLTWGSVNNSFPGTALPAQLAIANFETNSDAYDPVTGAPISTTVNFTASNTASNYSFEGTPVTLVSASFNHLKELWNHNVAWLPNIR
jgi:hypothetical protein